MGPSERLNSCQRPIPQSFDEELSRSFDRVGRLSVTKTAHDLDVTSANIYNWIKQDRIERGEMPGVSTNESKELTKARRRISELEAEVEILRRAQTARQGHRSPKGIYPVIDTLVDAGFSVKKRCEVLGSSSADYNT